MHGQTALIFILSAALPAVFGANQRALTPDIITVDPKDLYQRKSNKASADMSHHQLGLKNAASESKKAAEALKYYQLQNTGSGAGRSSAGGSQKGGGSSWGGSTLYDGGSSYGGSSHGSSRTSKTSHSKGSSSRSSKTSYSGGGSSLAPSSHSSRTSQSGKTSRSGGSGHSKTTRRYHRRALDDVPGLELVGRDDTHEYFVREIEDELYARDYLGDEFEDLLY